MPSRTRTSRFLALLRLLVLFAAITTLANRSAFGQRPGRSQFDPSLKPDSITKERKRFEREDAIVNLNPADEVDLGTVLLAATFVLRPRRRPRELGDS